MANNHNEGSSKAPSGDDETREIMEEMESDGFKTTEDEDLDEEEGGKKGKKEDAEKDDSDDDEDSDEEDSEEDEDDEEDSDEEDEDDDEKDEDEDSDDGEEKDEEDDEEDEAPQPKDKKDGEKPKRTPRFMPTWQHKKELKQLESRLRKELGKAAEDASDTGEKVEKDSDVVKTLVDQFAPELGMDGDKASKLFTAIINAASKETAKGIPLDKVKAVLSRENDRREEEEFQKDLRAAEKVARKLFGDMSDKDAERFRKKIRTIAYTEKYASYSLEDIVRLKRKDLRPKGGKKTGESQGSRGGKVSMKGRYNLDDPDSIPWSDLSDKEFDEVSEALEKHQGKPRLKITRKQTRR